MVFFDGMGIGFARNRETIAKCSRLVSAAGYQRLYTDGVLAPNYFVKLGLETDGKLVFKNPLSEVLKVEFFKDRRK